MPYQVRYQFRDTKRWQQHPGAAPDRHWMRVRNRPDQIIEFETRQDAWDAICDQYLYDPNVYERVEIVEILE